MDCLTSQTVFVSTTAFIVYANTLGADFVYDDRRAIITNADVISGSSSWTSILVHDFWGTPLGHSGSHKSYRPLATVSFRANFMLAELDPRSYHMTNVLLHCICSSLFLRLLRRLFLPHGICLFSALFFAVHPIHTEAVAGIVGRADILCTIFSLIGLELFAIYCENRENPKKSPLLLLSTALLTIFAIFSKEQGFSLLPVCFAYDLLRNGFEPLLFKPYKHSFYRTWLFLGSIFVFLLGFRLWIVNFDTPKFSSSDNPASHHASFVARTLTFFYLPLVNLKLLFLPIPLCFDWSMDSIPMVISIADYRAWFTVIFYAIFVWTILQLARMILRENYRPENINKLRSPSPKLDINANIKRRERPVKQDWNFDTFPVISKKTHCENLAIGLVILIVPFISASNLFVYVGFVIAERILYLPSIGYCILLSIGINFFWQHLKKDSKRRRIFEIICMTFLVIFAIGTIQRNSDWKSEETLFESGIGINPAKAYSNLGNVLAKQKKRQEAEEAYRMALNFRPNMADTHYNLGTLLHEQYRDLSAAIVCYRNALTFRPRMAVAHLNLGLALWSLQNVTSAALQFQHCSTLNDDHLRDPVTQRNAVTSCQYNMGRLMAEIGRYRDAVLLYTKAMAGKSSDYSSTASLMNMLGEAESKLGHFNKAEDWFNRVLKEEPQHVPAYLTMGHLRLKQNRISEARQCFEMAVRLSPSDSSVLFHMGQFLEQIGDLHPALRSFELSLHLDPSNGDVLLALANLNRNMGDNEKAEANYQQLVRIKSDANSFANYGAILHLNKKLTQAEEAYMEALRRNPEDRTTRANLKKLKRLKLTNNIEK